MAGNRYGGNKYGGKTFGGKRFGGNKFGKSAGETPKKPIPDDWKKLVSDGKGGVKEAESWSGAGGSTKAMRGAGGSTKMNATGGGSGTKMAGGGHVRGWTSSAAAAPSVKGTVRNTGAGYTGEKGNDATPPAKSAKMAAEVAAPPKAAKPVGKSYKAKGPADYNKDLGRIYLQATENMFSSKAGGKKK